MLHDFLEIFKHAFNKFSLVGVKYLGKSISEDNRKYYRFIGAIAFHPPRQLFDSEVEENKPYILSELRKLNIDSNNCISRNFTKKILSGNQTIKKVNFQYIFDVAPRNIIDFDFNKKQGKIYLFVQGCGIS